MALNHKSSHAGNSVMPKECHNIFSLRERWKLTSEKKSHAEVAKFYGKNGIRGRDGWMPSVMQWIWTWAKSRRRWGTGRPGVLQSMGLQRVWHDRTTEQQYIYLYIGFFNVLAIVSSAAMNIGVHISFQIRVFVFSGYMHRTEIAGLYGISIVVFKWSSLYCSA